MVKTSAADFASLGGTKTFDRDLTVGQVYMPKRETFDVWFDAIFERQHYANHGPLVNRLDRVVAERLGVAHAVCVTNGTVALMVGLDALELSGDVVVPAFTFPATVQALHWLGLKPIFADVDPNTHMLTPATVEKALTPQTSCVLGVHVWGRACAPDALEAFCKERRLRLLFDACHGFGCSFNGKMIGNFGDAEVFSFHATKVINGAEGGCVTTNDDGLAAKLRTIRSFHRSPADRDTAVRINGKMAEAQAAMALMALSNYESLVEKNCAIYSVYRDRLGNRSDVSQVIYREVEKNNYQHAVFVLNESAGLSRDELLTILRAEGVLARRYFAPGVHKLFPYNKIGKRVALPVTDKLCRTTFQLPVGSGVFPHDAEKISDLVSFALDHASEFKGRLEVV